MANYTVELASMLNAHANLQNRNPEEWKLLMNDNRHDNNYTEFITGPFKVYEPNELITKYAVSFFDKHVGADLRKAITNDAELNEAIYDRFCQTFIRHFYSYEIGQENPMNFLVALRAFCDQHLPLWYQGYQQLFIEKAQWVTNTSHSNSLTKSNADTVQNDHNSSIAGQADTPQNELNFKLNTGDPAQDYNFNYSSNVNGAKSTADSTNNQTATSNTTTDTTGRNATIMSLIDEMMGYADGIYFNLFTKAKQEGLFLLTM